ncbi:MAG: hypothetical protein ABEK75_06380 [Salinibacter sp.]
MTDQSTNGQEAEKVEALPLESLDQKISDLTPEQMDAVTKSVSFREATAKLMAGSISFVQWEWFASRTLKRRLDLPFVQEAMEKNLFGTAFEVFGAALEGLLAGGSGSLDGVTKDDEFRAAVLDLLQGDATVPEFLDVAGEVIDTVVDIPYVPQFGEDLVFDRGMELLASALHGLLTEGTESA